MRTEILYEDAHILVCRKPAGIAVQSANASRADMESELKNYLSSTLPKGKAPYLGVVHRLDQPVKGVLVFAKTPQAAASLSKQVQDGTMEKIYHARVYGHPAAEEETLTDYLYKDGSNNTSSVVTEAFRKGPKGKLAKEGKLSYRVLSRAGEGTEAYADLEVRLFTGRHHQIRVQLSHAGHPILGDTKYGNEASLALTERLEIKELALEAFSLRFRHPATGKTMHMKSV